MLPPAPSSNTETASAIAPREPAHAVPTVLSSDLLALLVAFGLVGLVCLGLLPGIAW